MACGFPSLPEIAGDAPGAVDCGNALIGNYATCSEDLSRLSGGTYDLALDAACDAAVWSISSTAETLTATFTPAASGLSSCTVHVNDIENPSPDPFRFTFRGNGQTRASLSVADALSFGDIRYNDAAITNHSTRTIAVSNTGDESLTITGVAVYPQSSSGFSIVSGGTSGTITKGNPKTWTIEFNPSSSAGPKSASVTFTSSDLMRSSVVTFVGGTATTAAINVSATSIDYGVVANGMTRTDDIAVINSAVANGGPLGVTRAVITGGSWFTFASCTTPSNRDCNSVLRIANSSQALVGVNCSPPFGASGSQTAQVTFTSDSDSGTANVANLTCTSANVSVAAAMSSIDFGSKLVIRGGGTSITTQIPVTNKGTLDSTIAFNLSSGTPNQFSVTCAGGATTCMVPKNNGVTDGMAIIDVTFTPTLEGDLFTNLDINLNGGSKNGPSASLIGRGVDKHLGLVTDLAFTDTFRNPGDNAPSQTIPITNDGEYELQVTALDVTGDPVWSLSPPFSPFAVPPLSSTDVIVTFAPSAEGKAPMGTLTVGTNDVLVTGRQTITFLGTGKLRNVGVVPRSIDIGETVAGFDARLSITRPSEILTVINMDTETFKIRDLKVEGPNAEMFRVTNLDGSDFASLDIQPGSSQTFDVMLSPPDPGDFEGTIVLYLDQDMVAQQLVPIRGHAQEGSGGCSTTGAPGSAGLLLVAGSLIIVRRRRRLPARGWITSVSGTERDST